MPVAALLAPLAEAAIGPALGIEAGTLGATALEAGLGAGLGAGSGAAFGALTGEGAGPGALSGAIGGAAGPIGGAIGEATGIGATAGEAIGGAAGGAGGALVTGGNPLIGAAEGGATGLAAGLASGSGAAAAPSAEITPTSTAASPAGAPGAAGSAGAQTAAATSSIPLDPTAGATPSAAGISGPSTSGGGSPVDGVSAMGLSPQDPFAAGGFGGGPGTPPVDLGPNPGGPAFAGSAGTDFSSDAGAGAGGLAGFGSSLMNTITQNPGLLLSGGLLAMNLLKGNQPYPAETQLNTLATNAATEGASLQSYIQSGTLPPGAKQAVDSATNAAKASVRSNYARMGLSGSTMEAQALGEVDRSAAAQTFQMADQLLSAGANYSQLAGNLYNAILQSQMSTDKELQQSLMTFAGGLSGLRGGGATA